MLPNLNKENFWDKAMELYPEAVTQFCNWIDEYKKEVGWKLLFNSDSEYQNAAGKNAPAPKFHDLPIEMQMGIIARYQAELEEGKEDYLAVIKSDGPVKAMMEFFAGIQKSLSENAQ